MHKIISRIIFWFIIGSQSLCSYSQSSLFNKINKYNISNKNFADTIPIEFIQNRIYVPVTIHNRVYRFVLDTGSFSCALHDEDLASEYNCIGRLNVKDINNTDKKGLVVKVSSLMIDKLEFKDCPMISLKTQLSPCTDINGIIGVNILKDKILKIDIHNRVIILTDRKNFFKDENGRTLPFKIYNDYIPHFSIIPTNNCKDEVIFDTGNMAFYSMSYKYYKKLMREKIQLPIVDKGFGKFNRGVWGTGNDTTNLKFQLDDFAFDDLAISNVKTILCPSINSSIGADILNYGSMILDYIHKNLIFIPYQNKNAVASKYDYPSFKLIPENRKVKIGAIWEKSEAYHSGLRNGFIVRSVNGIYIQDICGFINQWPSLKGDITMECLDLKNNPIVFHFVK